MLFTAFFPNRDKFTVKIIAVHLVWTLFVCSSQSSHSFPNTSILRKMTLLMTAQYSYLRLVRELFCLVCQTMGHQSKQSKEVGKFGQKNGHRTFNLNDCTKPSCFLYKVYFKSHLLRRESSVHSVVWRRYLSKEYY